MPIGHMEGDQGRLFDGQQLLMMESGFRWELGQQGVLMRKCAHYSGRAVLKRMIAKVGGAFETHPGQGELYPPDTEFNVPPQELAAAA